MLSGLDRLVEALQRERESYPSIAAMADDAQVSYDALYALLTGRRDRGVHMDMLVRLCNKFPAVAGVFLPLDSPIRSEDTQNEQHPVPTEVPA